MAGNWCLEVGEPSLFMNWWELRQISLKGPTGCWLHVLQKPTKHRNKWSPVYFESDRPFKHSVFMLQQKYPLISPKLGLHFVNIAVFVLKSPSIISSCLEWCSVPVCLLLFLSLAADRGRGRLALKSCSLLMTSLSAPRPAEQGDRLCHPHPRCSPSDHQSHRQSSRLGGSYAAAWTLKKRTDWLLDSWFLMPSQTEQKKTPWI